MFSFRAHCNKRPADSSQHSEIRELTDGLAEAAICSGISTVGKWRTQRDCRYPTRQLIRAVARRGREPDK